MLGLWARAEGLEEYDFSALDGAAPGWVENAKEYAVSLAKGERELDAKDMWGRLREAAAREAGEAAGTGCAVLLCVLLSGACAGLDGAGRGAQVACRAAGGAAMTGAMVRCASSAREWAAAIRGAEEAITPILTGLMAATGAEGTSQALYPLMGLCQWAAGFLLTDAGPALCCAGAAVSAAGGLGGEFRMGKLARGLTGAAGWLAGGLVSGFLLLSGAAGSLGSARDGVALRSAKYAVDSLFPVAGGELSSALGAAAGSAAVLRQAVGVTGGVIILGVCAGPCVKLFMTALCVKAALMLGEGAGDKAAVEMGEGFERALYSMLACLAASAVLALIWIGAALTFGRWAAEAAS